MSYTVSESVAKLDWDKLNICSLLSYFEFHISTEKQHTESLSPFQFVIGPWDCTVKLENNNQYGLKYVTF